MRTLIIGAGAVGSILGGYLARGSRDVTIADGWPRHVEAVRANGLRVEAVEGDFTVQLPAIHLDEVADFGAADLVIIACKSYDTRLMALLAREHLHSRTIVMSAQNGMNDATVADVVGGDRVVACIVALGADLLDPGRVRRSSPTDVTPAVFGHLRPGLDEATLQRLEEHFRPLGAVRTALDAWPERWGKLTLNTMSNAVAGLTALESNRLWSEPLTLDIIVALGHETAMVARAAGVAAVPVLGRISQDLLVDATSRTSAAWREATELMRQISAQRVGRASNRASLLQDVMKGRRTEIDYLNGWVVRRAKELDVAVPVHARIVDELRPIDLGMTPPSLDNAKNLAAYVEDIYR